MAGLLRNKFVAITGSSSGIGRATAIACAKQGGNLLLHHLGDSRAKEDIATLQKELKSIDPKLEYVDHGGDLTQLGVSEALVKKAKDSFGTLDVLVNNAGICKFDDFHAVTRETMDRHLAVNTISPFFLTQAATRLMKEGGHGGSVVNIASITATQGSSQLTHYAATKAAILGFTFSAAVALGPDGIRFNSVCPGTTETSMNKDDLDKDDKRTKMALAVPLRRLGKPEDIAGAVVFFASDLAAYVSGQSLIVDGGASINYQ
ncbi:short-chain dehydrogenase/reductase SDR [Rhizodiscina lignyota]|uniref:Short-chain dehydrogenase/reductase SDR n=1 Tax=Rhizodiscina lignyota TaxID=1504668 RepID=A0A9P4M7S5_9PEZI|nr:short-chain dehydrogenase/reductase SDR [Rhizodiscina lignyota]